jgi:hypothetical protein
MTEAELHAWTDGTETYVAESVDAAMAMQRELAGDDCDQEPADEWRAFPPGKVFTIDLSEEDRGKVTKTIAEWILENGPGKLCSTEW